MAAALDSAGVRRAYQHLFLPPELPQAADGGAQDLQFALFARNALAKLHQALPTTQRPIALDRSIALLDSLLDVNSTADASISEPKLLQQIKRLSNTGSSGTTVACYVAAQNAAVLISKLEQNAGTDAKTKLIFEAFELSPRNSAVYKQAGRLRRSFPGPAVAVDLDQNPSAEFAPAVAAALSKMSSQSVEGMQPASRKAGSYHVEQRDTSSPAAVTDLFVGFLRSFGEPILVDYISKNTREEVLWQQALAPWRRSPVWLLVRVALQLVISRAPDGSRKMYKQAMTCIITRLSQEAQRLNFPSEDLHVMNAKISARLIKLSAHPGNEASFHPGAMAMLDGVLASSAALIEKRWKNIRERDSHDLDLSVLSGLDFESDARVELPALDSYLNRLRAEQYLGRQVKCTAFVPQSSLMLFGRFSLPQLQANALDDLAYANVHHFEDWIAQHLTDWVYKFADVDACEKLCELMLQYHRLATSLYTGNPEATSIMILTIFELFIACDRAAIKQCQLLERFDPGIPQTVLQNLLLPKIGGLKRLSAVEYYLNTRSSSSSHMSTSLFDLQRSTGFAYQFFEQSSEHRVLYEEIQHQAKIDKDTKRFQFQQLRKEHQRLSDLYDQSQCEYKDVVIDDWCDPPETESQHQPGCKKCRYQNQIKSLNIDVFEEPLPRSDVEAKAVVFELAVPSWIACWRDAHTYLLVDVLQGATTTASLRATYELSKNDPHLTRNYHKTTKPHRVDLLSESKPVVSSHYRNIHIESNSREGDVIVDNGLAYRYWDSKARAFVGTARYEDDVAKSCTYHLPVRALQRFVSRTSLTPDGEAPNAVIASLDACPDDMSLEEYKELSTIPLGRHIQWANIELQLAMPSVDFKKQLSTLVFLQCVHQAGPSNGDVLRDAHNILHDDGKVRSVLNHLSEAVERVKQNWESAEALGTFTAIAARLLSVNTSCKDHALGILHKIRTIAAEWMHTISARAHAAEEQEHRTVFVTKGVEIALLCSFAYDVDDQHLSTILTDEENTSRLIEAAVAVQQGENSHPWKDLHSKLLLFRHKRLLHRCYSLLSQNQAGLDLALRQVWSSYKAGTSGWSLVSTAPHWVTTETSDRMQVHLDLLSGEVRVNGVPLGLIPSQYRNQPLYGTLFGKSAVETLPAPDPRFEFSSKKEFQGQVVQLALREVDIQGLSAKELVVQAVESSDVYETISSGLFRQCFPNHFVHDYVHWYHAGSNTVHFRPSGSAWNTDRATGWLLSPSCGSGWTLARAGNAAIGLQKSTSRKICQQLSSLADDSRIHCVLQANSSVLSIDIPSLHLGFRLKSNSTSLQSREYRSMQLDYDQSIQTLVGLANKLVLRSKSGERLVLLPEASVSWTKDGEHPVVSMSKSSIKRIHAVHIDTLLRRLKDSGDLQGKLYLAYLHALTSHCYPDPLTCKTGTEEALTILRSSAVRSFDSLSQDNVDTLAKIARLSPRRCFYPPQERVMQTVSWDSQLGFMAQHGALSAEVQAIFNQAQRNSVFFPVPALPPPSSIESSLEKRYTNRSAQFRVAGFGAEACDHGDDGLYASRDGESVRGVRSAQIASLLLRDGDDLAWPHLSANQLWDEMSALSAVKGPSHAVPGVRYSASYAAANGHIPVLEKLPSLLIWLQDVARQTPGKQYFTASWLAALGYSTGCKLEVLQVLVHAFKGGFVGLIPPTLESFSPRQGMTLVNASVQSTADRHRRDMNRCPESRLERNYNEKLKNYNNRRRTAWRTASSDAKQLLILRTISQWPCRVPTSPSTDGIAPYYNVQGVMNDVKPLFAAWHDNRQLFQYLVDLAARLREASKRDVQLPALQRQDSSVLSSAGAHISPADVFASRAPLLTSAEIPSLTLAQRHVSVEATAEPPRVGEFVKNLQSKFAKSSAFAHGYAADLSESAAALRLYKHEAAQVHTPERALDEYRDACQQHFASAHARMVAAAQETQHTAPLIVQQFPRIAPAFFLQQLSHLHWKSLPLAWKPSIVSYALALVALQRAERLVKLESQSKKEELVNELYNHGHANWDPMQHPESLLVEVESGFLIRPVQEDIAAQMRSPSSSQNAVMQLNMGEGKSSVIVPIVAAALADGQQLVRVIVAKPQSKQMAQMLISKLGGLVDRRVYYMPFSRSIKLDEPTARLIHRMLRECMSNGGILLVQPEHILSLKLAAPECYATDRPGVGKSLMATQDFFDKSARDIVDESDENFSVRFELIYTMGSQSSIEGSPDRWFIIQQVLELVAAAAPSIAKKLPHSIEVHEASPDSFPRIRILRADAEGMLIHEVAKRIRDFGLDGFQLSRQPQTVREAVFTYMTRFELTGLELDAVERGPFWTDATKTSVLLLRGLFAGGILAFALGQKRWRVNYGLAVRDPPTKLAVPYRAKDSPSPRSEFSHPDVVLTLTMLCYYYEGSTDDELFTSLAHLMDSDQADAEYQAWVGAMEELPAAFRQLQGINLKDRLECIATLFPYLRRSKKVADYYLSHIVFPKEMKQFPDKLSASGWDIGKAKGRLTTGFSGTNDSRCLLPLDVGHLDLEAQKHTNALVLEYLLKPENTVQLMAPTTRGSSDAQHLLETVGKLKPPVQVILDVGAQILELNNQQVAIAWLKATDLSKEAAIFVDDSDELCVVDRSGRVDLLQTSSFASRLDTCLVFLDESHTRGIDLKLPLYYRAAVTLGANLTKDRLVQACMRMRKLGKGQSVAFCVSEEIQTKIQAIKWSNTGSPISVSDVLFWSITETCNEIRRSMPLWATQGERFTRHVKLWQEVNDSGRTTLTKSHAEKFLEKEAQSIEVRYRPQREKRQPAYLMQTEDTDIKRIADRCREFDNLQFNAGTLQEEQERELSPEIEQERQVQRAPAAKPSQHGLHEDVKDFAMNGTLKALTSAYTSAWTVLSATTAAANSPVLLLAEDTQLLATIDFATTVKTSGSVHMPDVFQRPVQWLLTTRTANSDEIGCVMVVSPYEANLLYPLMKGCKQTALHLYKPRSNMGYGPLDKLDFHTVSGQAPAPALPRSLAAQLNLFAGQLYMTSYEDYLETCKFLGLSTDRVTEAMTEQGWKVDADGFILSDGTGRKGGRSRLSKSPNTFFRVFLSKVRRNGDGIAKTHMGSLLDGKLFEAGEFEE